MNRYRLTLRSLKFLSAVDFPAQEPAVCVLTKRKDLAPEVKASYRVIKTDEALGVVIGMSIVTSVDGVPYSDLQGDEVQESDLLKTVVEFMESGAPTDTQHNREQDGRVVLSWVFDKETNEAMGVTSRKHGWATGLKVSPETFAKFKSGELSGFSIDGVGTREPIEKSAKRVCNALLYTDEVDGHQHQILCYEDGTFWVQHATSAGAEHSHSHGIVRGDDGTLAILADSGHAHVLAAGQPALVIVPADAIVVVQARAPQSADSERAAKSTPLISPRSVSPTSKESTMPNELDTLNQTLLDITKRAERAERIAKMSGAHKAHFDSLTGDDAEAFLAKSTADRETIVKATSDREAALGELVYTSLAGEVFTKRDDARLVAAVKRADDAERIRDEEQIAKRAQETLGQLAGSDAVHQLIVRAVLKSGAKKEDIDAALTAMKGWGADSRIGKRAPGVNPGAGPVAVDQGAAFAALSKGLATFAKTNSISDRSLWTDGLEAYVKTDEGAALKRAYDEAQ